MIASMTGFARRELAGSWGTLTCELRSVNHRYLEPGFRLERIEDSDRRMRYSLRSYATDRPSGERYVRED